MIHIIDGVEYTKNPLLCPEVAEALVLGEFVTVIDDFGVILHEGPSQQYAYSLIQNLNSFSIRIDEHDCDDECEDIRVVKKFDNVIDITEYLARKNK